MPEIGDVLARCLDEIESGRPVADVLAQYGERAAELAPLVAAAIRLRAAAHPAPSAAFREAARARLLARIGAASRGHVSGTVPLNGHANGHASKGQLNGYPPNGRINGHANGHGRADPDALRSPSWHRRDIVGIGPARRRPLWAQAFPKLVAACLLISTLVGGTVAASADSLPGDVLYPAKIAVEQVQLATTTDDADRARLHIEFADRRAVELEKKIDHLDEATATQLVTQYAAEVEAAAIALQKASRRPELAVQEKVAVIGTKLAEETAVKNIKLDQIAEQKPSVEQPIKTARVVAERAIAVQPIPAVAQRTITIAGATATDVPSERAAVAPTLVPTVTVAPPAPPQAASPPGALTAPPSPTTAPSPAPAATATSRQTPAVPRPPSPVGEVAIVALPPPAARLADAAIPAPTETPAPKTPSAPSIPPGPAVLTGPTLGSPAVGPTAAPTHSVLTPLAQPTETGALAPAGAGTSAQTSPSQGGSANAGAGATAPPSGTAAAAPTAARAAPSATAAPPGPTSGGAPGPAASPNAPPPSQSAPPTASATATRAPTAAAQPATPNKS